MFSLLISKTCAASVQDFIFTHENDDENLLVLLQKEILGLPASWVAQQIAGRKRIKAKLPQWYKTRKIIYPPTLNLEQASSEAAARFKSTFIGKGENGLDLTAGFGVDSFYFAKHFKKFIVVEPDENLVEVAKHNHLILGCSSIGYKNAFAKDFIKNTEEKFDFIYIDPSRRNRQQKVFKFADCTPNVVELLPALLQRSEKILVKASPLIDLHQGVKELTHTTEILVLSVGNECKEVLFVLQNSISKEPPIHTIELNPDGTIKNAFSFRFEEEKECEISFSSPLTWLYEPNVAILKAGAFKIIANKYGLFKLHVNSHLYTSEQFRKDFPGRIFKISEHIKLDKKAKDFFPDGYANIISRNYPLSVDEIKKKTGLKEGGDLYLICTQSEKQKEVLIAERFLP